MQTRLTLPAIMLVAITHSARAQDVAAGEQVFKKCFPCHSIGEGAKNKIGPELNGINDRHSAIAPEYNYSEANKKSGIVWNEQNFKQYIKDPRAMIPGTKMIFPGIQNETDIENLWAYLKQFGPDGKKKGS